jgi:hypothetical protein
MPHFEWATTKHIIKIKKLLLSTVLFMIKIPNEKFIY